MGRSYNAPAALALLATPVPSKVNLITVQRIHG